MTYEPEYNKKQYLSLLSEIIAKQIIILGPDIAILKAKNIIIQHVDYDIIDSYGRLDINLKSGGEAEIYLDGKKIDGYWKKTKGKTRFFNQNKEEIRLNSGTTWIELMFN